MKNYRIIKIFAIFVVSLTFCFNINHALAGETLKNQFSDGLSDTAIGTGHIDATGTQTGMFAELSLVQAIGYVVGILLSLVGVFFLMLMIYGGYVWMMARGNEQEAVKAKNTIINAVIGMAVVFSAYLITKFMSNEIATILAN